MQYKHIAVNIGFVLFLCIATGCHTYRVVQPVVFSSPVDTRDKTIQVQVKKAWQLGHLTFSNTFDGARLNDIVRENDSTFIAYIRPENRPINPSPWYAFTINTDSAGTYYCILDYDDYAHRYSPKVGHSGTFVALDTSAIDSLSPHQVRIRLTLQPGEITLAGQPVVSSGDVDAWMDAFAEKWDLRYRTYGNSREGRPLNYLDISRGHKRRPIVVLLCRQHPPEVTGWFALQYFLMELMENTEFSKAFLDKYRVVVYPILNPDGVNGGFWRHNTGGVDLNRDWSEYRQPEIAQTVQHIVKLARDQPVVLALDFHSTYSDIFYTNDESEKPSVLPGFKDEWLNTLRSGYPEFQFEERNSMPQTPVSKNWFYRYFNATAITYEIGDNTPEDIIELKGRASAAAMMAILARL